MIVFSLVFALGMQSEIALAVEPPVCDDSTVTVQRDKPTSINFACHDAWGAKLAIQFVSGLEHGTVLGHPNPLVYEQVTQFGSLQTAYTPGRAFVGKDTLKFRAVKLYMPPCPEHQFCSQVMSESYSNEATVSIQVRSSVGTGELEGFSFQRSCANGNVKKLRTKLQRSRKRYRNLKRKYRSLSKKARAARNSESRRRYKSSARRVRASYKKTMKRSNRLRAWIIACNTAGY